MRIFMNRKILGENSPAEIYISLFAEALVKKQKLSVMESDKKYDHAINYVITRESYSRDMIELKKVRNNVPDDTLTELHKLGTEKAKEIMLSERRNNMSLLKADINLEFFAKTFQKALPSLSDDALKKISSHMTIPSMISHNSPSQSDIEDRVLDALKGIGDKIHRHVSDLILVTSGKDNFISDLREQVAVDALANARLAMMESSMAGDNVRAESFEVLVDTMKSVIESSPELHGKGVVGRAMSASMAQLDMMRDFDDPNFETSASRFIEGIESAMLFTKLGESFESLPRHIRNSVLKETKSLLDAASKSGVLISDIRSGLSNSASGALKIVSERDTDLLVKLATRDEKEVAVWKHAHEKYRDIDHNGNKSLVFPINGETIPLAKLTDSDLDNMYIKAYREENEVVYQNIFNAAKDRLNINHNKEITSREDLLSSANQLGISEEQSKEFSVMVRRLLMLHENSKESKVADPSFELR